MKKFYLITLVLVVNVYSATSQRYGTQLYNQVSVETVTYFNQLEMDIYQATDNKQENRPILLFVHGGGFAGGARNEPEIIDFCKNMARRGIVTASMSYSLLMKGKSFGCDQPAKNKLNTFQHVANEVTAATNFLLNRASDLRVDDKKIVLVGSSAGAEAVLHAAFSDESLSKLPAEFRYGGLISMAGAISNLEIITDQSAIPMQLFHGTCDELVPYGKAPHHYCQESDVGYLTLYGSGAIVKKLKALNKGYYLVTGCQDDHIWAGIPFKEKFSEIADFVEQDVIEEKFRQIHQIIESDQPCQLVEAPGICGG